LQQRPDTPEEWASWFYRRFNDSIAASLWALVPGERSVEPARCDQPLIRPKASFAFGTLLAILVLQFAKSFPDIIGLGFPNHFFELLDPWLHPDKELHSALIANDVGFVILTRAHIEPSPQVGHGKNCFPIVDGFGMRLW
jgi:hypothetical protein